MTFDIPTVEKLVAHFDALQGLSANGWTFAPTQIVPGLLHNGEAAWAVVESDPRAKTIKVQVLDIVKTPVVGFRGDPWHELQVTISHELWHPWVTLLLADPTEANEEALVEAAAQAVVNSRGVDARVMARSVAAIPKLCRDPRIRTEVRARLVNISARSTRARGGTAMAMDGKAVLAAIKDQDEAAALSLLMGWVAEQIAAAQGDPAPAVDPLEPDGDEMVTDAPPEARGGDVMDPNNKPGGPPAGPAARPLARSAVMLNHETQRARKASDALNRSAIRARIYEVRTVDGVTLSPELERLVMGETDIEAADKLLKVAALARGEGTQARARSGVQPTGAPPPAAPPIDAAALLAEGIHPQMVDHIVEVAKHDPASAQLSLKSARARLVALTPPWPTAARPQNGGAS